MNRKIARKRKKVSKKFMDKFWEGFPENRSVEKDIRNTQSFVVIITAGVLIMMPH